MADQDDKDGDIDPADLEDLGDLGDGDDGDDEDEDGEYTPPDKAAWDKLQRKLARQEDRITRLVGKAPKVKAGGAPVDRQLATQLKGGKPAEPADEDSGDDGEAERWRGIAIQNAASAQIAAAGFNGTARQATRLARLIDTSNVEPGRDGSFDLEDEIEELVEEYPQLFAKQAGGRRVPVVRRGDASQTPKKDPTQNTTDKMLRQAGYR